jgi:hypothetical protein
MPTSPVRFSLLALMLLTVYLGSAKADNKSQTLTGIARFDDGNMSVTLPAKFTQAHILVETTINGRGPYYLALDTGASVSTVAPGFISNVLKLTPKKEMNERKWPYVDVSLRVPGVDVTNQRFFPVIDYMVEAGVAICGILGYDFIQHFVLEIDYFHKTVTLHDPKSYHYSDENDLGTQFLPFTLEGLAPHIKLNVRFGQVEPVMIKALIDTGSGHALLFTEEAKKRLRIEGQVLKDAQLGSIIIHPSGSGIHRPNALSKPPFTFDALLGNPAFENMKVVFDYPNKRIITAYPFKNESEKICCN